MILTEKPVSTHRVKPEGTLFGIMLRWGRKSPSSLLFPIDSFAPLVTFLSLDRQGGDRPRFQPLEGNRLAGFLAIAVGAVFDALQGGIDLGDQLALPIAGPQLDRPVGFG